MQLWSPGELGVAQAYVTEEIDVPGDLRVGLDHVLLVISARDLNARRPAQEAKNNLVRSEVGLQAGDHLQDFGCGWGSLAIHVAGRQ